MKINILHRKKGLVCMASFSALAVLLLTPLQVSAETHGFAGLISEATDLLNQLVPLLATLTLVAFFWGLAKYIFNAGSDEGQEQGKRIMIAGIVALFLIASIGGIIEFLLSAFGFEGGGSITPPSIDTEASFGVDSSDMVYNKGDGIG